MLCLPFRTPEIPKFRDFLTTENREIRLLASTVASDFQKTEKGRKSKQICRCDGIGRRDGLKIRWTYHPCGFESHHRHQVWLNERYVFSTRETSLNNREVSFVLGPLIRGFIAAKCRSYCIYSLMVDRTTPKMIHFDTSLLLTKESWLPDSYRKFHVDTS